MTAVSMIQLKDGIAILTDGGSYSADGTLTALGEKCFALPSAGVAIVGRGPKPMIPLMMAELSSRFSCYDEVIADTPQILFNTVALWPTVFPQVLGAGQIDPGFEIWIAGYSDERKRFEAALIPTHAGYEGVAAFHTKIFPESIVAPVPSLEHFRQFGIEHIGDGADFDPEFHGLKLMEAQRMVDSAYDTRSSNGLKGCIVSGFAQLTVVRRNGISTKILKRWPDKIGDKLSVTTRPPVFADL